MTVTLYPSRLWGMNPAQRILTLRKWMRGLPPFSSILTEACSYLSVWNMVLLWVQPHIHPSIVAYTSLFCAVGGFYMAWVFPRFLEVHYLHVRLGFWESVITDIVAHQLPRLFFLSNASSSIEIHKTPTPTPTTVLFLPRSVVLLYLVWYGFHNIRDRYLLRDLDLFLILLLTELVYCFMHNKAYDA